MSLAGSTDQNGGQTKLRYDKQKMGELKLTLLLGAPSFLMVVPGEMDHVVCFTAHAEKLAWKQSLGTCGADPSGKQSFVYFPSAFA